MEAVETSGEGSASGAETPLVASHTPLGPLRPPVPAPKPKKRPGPATDYTSLGTQPPIVPAPTSKKRPRPPTTPPPAVLVARQAVLSQQGVLTSVTPSGVVARDFAKQEVRIGLSTERGEITIPLSESGSFPNI